VAEVSSKRRRYGRLMAAFDSQEGFFPQERELFEVYARYAASALDGAAALMEAKRRHDESSALLRLARALASAGTSDEVARRLADAVPLVVDCDRVGVYLWDPSDGQLVRRAIAGGEPGPTGGEPGPTGGEPGPTGEEEEWRATPAPGGPVERLLANPSPEPLFVDRESGDPAFRSELQRLGDEAGIVVPIATAETFLGFLAVSVSHGRERMLPSPDLLNRLSGVAAQATTALQNGRLVDQITHQATHDQLTGLANRMQFTDEVRRAVSLARNQPRLVTVFYIDLDGFKPVNDQFGHDVGDELLAAVGARLSECMRSGDTVARLGGDEFAVLISHAGDAAQVDGVAERLADVFRTPFLVGGRELALGASIGRAAFPSDAGGADELLRHADLAMFAAKRGALARS
jgi:diguanylate cyclase (GGDEF)-like protein